MWFRLSPKQHMNGASFRTPLAIWQGQLVNVYGLTPTEHALQENGSGCSGDGPPWRLRTAFYRPAVLMNTDLK